MINPAQKRLQWKGCQNLRVFTVMAVPKKKTSKTKRNQRKAVWKRKAALQAQRALSLGKSILTERSNFVYKEDEDSDEED